MTKTLKDIQAEAGTIKAQVLEDAKDTRGDTNEELSYVQDVANNGCISGTCNNLIYNYDTHAFYAKHADEIDKMLEEYEDSMGDNVLARATVNGDLRTFLAWWSYEVRAQEIMDELEELEEEE